MKLFYEKYIKLAHIGKGANAHVYKVRHAELGYVRAIKILNEDIESKEDRAYQSFLKECKTLLTIGNGAHPNIIRIYGPDLIDNHAIVEMDYVQGTTLDSYIKDKGFLDYDEVRTFIHDIVGALAYTHHDIYRFLMNPEDDDLQQDPNDGKKYVITPEKEAELVKKYGIAHNDLHSNNVMRRDYDGSFVLLDFGLAVQDGECIKSSRKSDGHPEYMAPEKFDSGDITPRSDVYSLGVLIYEILTGRPPFVLDYDSEGKVSYPALSKICNEHHNQTPPAILPLRKIAFERQIPGAVYERDYPEWLDEVVMKCLAKSPEDRYADVRELLDDINWHVSQDRQDSQHTSQSSKPNEDKGPDKVNPPYAKNDSESVGSLDKPKPKNNKKKLLLITGGCLVILCSILFFISEMKHRENTDIALKSNIIIPVTEYRLNLGDSIVIDARVQSPLAEDTIITWTPYDPEIVNVKGDTIIGLKIGETVLNASIARLTVGSAVKITVVQNNDSVPKNESSIKPTENNSQTADSRNNNTVASKKTGQGKTDTPISTSQSLPSEQTKMNMPNSIQETLSVLLNKDIPRETRLEAIPSVISKFFESNAKVKTIGDSGIILEIEDVDEFLRRIILSRRVNRVKVVSIEKGSKITELCVQN